MQSKQTCPLMMNINIQSLYNGVSINSCKMIRVNAKVAHFLKKQKSTKVHFTMLNFLFIFCTMGSMVIKSMS